MKKVMTALAKGLISLVSAKNQKVEQIESVKPFCIQVLIRTSCQLNEYVTWCPEYGDTFQCLLNEADGFENLYCGQP